MARLFLAVWPPDDVIADLMALRRKDERGVHFVSPDRWHITLRFLGEAHPDDTLEALSGCECEPSHVVLGPAVDVLEGRVVVVPASGLDHVADEVIRRTRNLGTSRPRRKFVGHLTLARVSPRVPMPRVLGQLVHSEFDVIEIALVQSRLERDHARYETLATWPVG